MSLFFGRRGGAAACPSVAVPPLVCRRAAGVRGCCVGPVRPPVFHSFGGRGGRVDAILFALPTTFHGRGLLGLLGLGFGLLDDRRWPAPRSARPSPSARRAR